MRTRQLECFIRVCELGSITKAATALNIAQPALGAQIKALENEFGAPLLIRTPEGVSPTLAGKIFADEAKYILGRLVELRHNLHQATIGERRPLTIGLPPSLAASLAHPLLDATMRLQAGRAVQLFEDQSCNLIEMVGTGRLDIAYAFNVKPTRQIYREPKITETLYFIASPDSPFGASGPISFSQVVEANLVMPATHDVIRQMVEDVAKERNITLRISYEVQSMHTIKNLIGKKNACAILSMGMVTREIKDGTLIARPIVDPSITRVLYLVRTVDSKIFDPAIARVIDELLDALCSRNASYAKY